MYDTAATIAFFDVDETLISVKSMFDFLAFHLEATPEEYDRIAGRLRALSAAGVPREETNRLYYRAYAGRSAAELRDSGERWFAAALARGGLFHEPVVAELHRHRAAGHQTVLVSGSFPPCLDPVARHLGAGRVECTRPIVAGGRYTGEVHTPVIGAAKAAVLRRVAAESGVDPRDCAAYGDHESDLPMLEAAGHPVVVGGDAGLARHAARSGWRRIPLDKESVHLPISL